MKKIFLLVAFLFSLFSLGAVERFFTFDIGLSSGYPFYGSKDVNDKNNAIAKEGTRLIFGSTLDFNFNLIDEISVFAGGDVLFDFVFTKTDYYNHIDFCFFPGIKVYPGVGGLNFSLAYVLGSRADFVGSEEEKSSSMTSWGNGIRVAIEYNFSHESFHEGYPSLGMYWRWIPRGNFISDNVLCAYVLVNL